MERSRAVGALDSFTPPQEYISCANRSPGFASSYLDAFPQAVRSQWLFVSVRRLHGYWGSSELSSAFPWRLFPPAPFQAQMHTLFI